MEILKKQFANIQQQISGLTISQKMLTAALVAIMAMTFVWWGRYAGSSEMEPLFNQSLNSEEMQRARQVLTRQQIKFEAAGDRIMVPVEKRDEAFSVLAYEQALPRDSSGTFEEMFSKMNPFQPESTRDKLFNEMLQSRLAKYISMWDNVADVNVLIDPTMTRGVSHKTEPSAAVAVRMKREGVADKRLAGAIADLVCGANANMHRSRVRIVIDGRTYPVKDADPNGPDSDIDEQQAKAEARFAEKVKEALSGWGGNVVAVVHAKIDLVSEHEQMTSFQNIKAKEKSNETENSNSTTPQTAGVPGAESNSGLAIPQAPVEGKTETRRSKTESEIFADKSLKETNKPAGEPRAISVAVSLPRGIFASTLKGSDATAKEPSAQDVEALFAQQKPQIAQQVMTAIGITDEKQVSIALGPNLPLLMATGSGLASGSSSGGVAVTLTSHIKEIAVGALALISLFMVSMLVKKNAPAPVVAAVIEDTEPVRLGGNIDIAGEVGEADQALDGMELDEDAIKAQQMVEQVSTLVQENPDGAANMVKRWLNRS